MKKASVILTVIFGILASNLNAQIKNNKNQSLTNSEVTNIHYCLCRDVYTDSVDFTTEHFRSIIANGIGIDPSQKGANKLISTFINDNHDNLICPKDPTNTSHRKKHIFKDMLQRGLMDIFDDIIMDDDEYTIDFNAYEMVNGKKETLIDYIEMMIDEDGDDDGDLTFLIEDIEDSGGKRGADLDK